VAVTRGRFGNPGRGTFAIGSRYHRTGVGLHSERTQCAGSELDSVRNRVKLQTVIEESAIE
jgi:hypothetical protein